MTRKGGVALTSEEYQSRLDALYSGMIELRGEYLNARTKVLHYNNVSNKLFYTIPCHVLSGRSLGLKASKGETLIAKFLLDHDITFLQEFPLAETSRTGSYLYADFFVPEFNLVIEFDGEQHFYPVKHFGGEEKFLHQKQNDFLKESYCYDNEIDLIRIPFYMLESIEYYLNSALLPPEMDEPCFDN